MPAASFPLVTRRAQIKKDITQIKRDLQAAITLKDTPLVQSLAKTLIKLRGQQLALSIEQYKEESSTIPDHVYKRLIGDYTKDCAALIAATAPALQ